MKSLTIRSKYYLLLALTPLVMWLSPAYLAQAQEGENVELIGQIKGIPPTVVSVTGNLAYIGVGPKMIIFDVGNPAKPVELGSFSTLKDIKGIALHGSLAYVAADTAGLRIVDISNPTNPVELSFFKPLFVGKVGFSCPCSTS